jgi:hypothetical protein
MQIDAIILLQGTTEAIEAWRFNTDQNGQFYTVNEPGSHIPHKDKWEELAIKINRLAYGGAHTPVDVFLYLRDPLRETFYNYGHLKNIVNYARNHTWAGNLYLVWDQQAGTAFSSLYPGNAIVLEKWFQVLSEERVTDLIEITKEIKSKYPDALNLLRVCADVAKQRRNNLRGFVTAEGWGVILRNEASLPEAFIKILVKAKLLPSDTTNKVIFFDQKPHFGLIELLDKSRRLSQEGSRLVTSLPKINSNELKYLCNREGLNEPIDFNGTFEWLYALIRLNQASRASAPTPLVGYSQEYFEGVEPSEERLFRLELNDGNLRLLVTSAFHHKDGEGYCIAAAQEIGALLRYLPFNIDIEVHPYINCGSLPGVLKDKQFTAWLHLGHGKSGQGLCEAGNEEYASPKRWLACFKAYQRNLQLVLLSVCESADIARLFAAAGVRVAIGFENEVLTGATKILTEKVIPAALQTGDRQEAIIVAFQEACRSLSSRTDLHNGEEKSYIDARPRAFGVRIKPS